VPVPCGSLAPILAAPECGNLLLTRNPSRPWIPALASLASSPRPRPPGVTASSAPRQVRRPSSALHADRAGSLHTNGRRAVRPLGPAAGRRGRGRSRREPPPPELPPPVPAAEGLMRGRDRGSGCYCIRRAGSPGLMRNNGPSGAGSIRRGRAGTTPAGAPCWGSTGRRERPLGALHRSGNPEAILSDSCRSLLTAVNPGARPALTCRAAKGPAGLKGCRHTWHLLPGTPTGLGPAL
jgi:hypothetical protein